MVELMVLQVATLVVVVVVVVGRIAAHLFTARRWCLLRSFTSGHQLEDNANANNVSKLSQARQELPKRQTQVESEDKQGEGEHMFAEDEKMCTCK